MADVVRTVLPSIIPPSYRGTTIRYLYYVRATLAGQWLILENGHPDRELTENVELLDATFRWANQFLLVQINFLRDLLDNYPDSGSSSLGSFFPYFVPESPAGLVHRLANRLGKIVYSRRKKGKEKVTRVNGSFSPGMSAHGLNKKTGYPVLDPDPDPDPDPNPARTRQVHTRTRLN
ncbi:hypothetical protein Cgig2_011535 [Carnegiea gigantea]|uniref:Uncharacterized protein n=1 Tax=Carnegiea gigantea TaxID=171969 RepID=A0A9Q1K4I1_9CARY|nr:hypothetical protein Cgig2_011535 [Carnegiea gigantea]